MIEYIDASVVVKWFKEDEPGKDKARKLYERIVDMDACFITSEWSLLEVTRALCKSGYKMDEIKEANEVLRGFMSSGALKMPPVSPSIGLAQKLEMELGLYASDAVHLATSINTSSSILWSEDQHHHKDKVKKYLKRHQLTVKRLDN